MLQAPSYISIVRDHGGGPGRYVAHDASTGAHFMLDETTRGVIEGLRAKRSLQQIEADSGLSPDEFKALVGRMVQNGLVLSPGETEAPKTPKGPPESRLIFFRVDLLNIRPVVEAGYALLRLPFTRFGFVAWIALMLTAGFALIADPDAFARAFAGFASLSWESAAILMGVIILLKVWHELGHATALLTFARAENFDPGPIRAGLAMFAFLPFPYTDATAAWRIQNRFRRAYIGMAGLYFESFAAAGAALLWAWIRPGETQTILFQILVIAGFSTLLFNLNPLIRLDGYFVFSDLLGLRNLAGRASQAAQSAGLRLVSKSTPEVDKGLLGYWALAFIYRCMIFAGIFWLAYQVDPRIAWAPTAIGVMLLFGRPLWTLGRRAWRIGLRPARVGMLALGLVLAVAMALVPIPDAVHLNGFMLRHEHEAIQAREGARLASYSEVSGQAPAVLQLESIDLALREAQLLLDLERVEGSLRAAGSRDPERTRLLRAEATRLLEQSTEARSRIEGLTVATPQSAIWRPDGAKLMAGGWIDPFENRRLGQIATPVTPFVRVYLDQAYSDLGDSLSPGAAVAVRPVSNPACVNRIAAREFAPVVSAKGPAFRLDADIPADADCILNLPEGAGVVVRIRREDASAVRQLYNFFRRLALNRLPIEIGARP